MVSDRLVIFWCIFGIRQLVITNLNLVLHWCKTDLAIFLVSDITKTYVLVWHWYAVKRSHNLTPDFVWWLPPRGIDLTHKFANGYTISWPTATQYNFTILFRLYNSEKGFWYESNDFLQSEHCGKCYEMKIKWLD